MICAMQFKCVIALLRKAGLKLRKWASNAPELISDINPHDLGLVLDKSLAVDEELKILIFNLNSDNGVCSNAPEQPFAECCLPALRVHVKKL